MQHKADYYQMMNQKNPSQKLEAGKEDQKVPGDISHTVTAVTKNSKAQVWNVKQAPTMFVANSEFLLNKDNSEK